jgi:23S rRNA pseudouridine1911/1915/1917 synthase
MIEIKISERGRGERLDIFLSREYPQFSRSYLQNLIKKGDILVNGLQVKTGYILLEQDTITIDSTESAPLTALAEDIPLEIVYEDEDIIVVNKPQGTVVYPAAGHTGGTLVNALLHHCQQLSTINGSIRPGIVHRLDKDTSGILVAAKNDSAHLALTGQWRQHKITRIYRALVHGIILEDKGIIDAPIRRHSRDRKRMAVEPKFGKHAVTNYQVLERFMVAGSTYLELSLETGRTHQIRVHMAYLKYPVLGDPVYGRRKEKYRLAGQALHAQVLGFHHPRTGEYMEFSAALPDYFEQLLEGFRAKDGR